MRYLKSLNPYPDMKTNKALAADKPLHAALSDRSETITFL